ncbi:MAG: ral secretion pathway protein [Proteobacteria bacterium]|nr:ral secretion pathway protein [Pseudomonadota bacterium]
MTESPTDARRKRRGSRPAGFSLLELSIVLVIVGLLANSMLLGFSALRETAAREDAEQQLANASEALLGFASRHGRLPCPAAPASNGSESTGPGGNCTHPWDGYLPAISLGIHPVDTSGYAVDPWGNPLRYAISAFTNPACGANYCLSNENGVRNAWNSDHPPLPDLRVCTSASGSTGSAGSAECASGQVLTKDAVAVIFSPGKNGKQTAAGSDEQANANNDRLFVSHSQSLPPNEFDDHLVWLSSNLYYSRLLAAGRLP